MESRGHSPEIQDPRNEESQQPLAIRFELSPRFSSSHVDEDSRTPEGSPLGAHTSKPRGLGYSNADDLLLIDAWLNTSPDPIVGTDQPGASFWGRIEAYYNQYKEADQVERDLRSLQNRWNIISTRVSKFCRCISSIRNKHIKDISEQEEIEKAKAMYSLQAKKNTPFVYTHCWVALRHTSKWIESSGKMKKLAPYSPSSSHVDLNNDMDVSGAGRPHPDGQKAAKRKAKETASSGGGEVNSSLEMMLQRLIDKNNVVKTTTRREETHEAKDMNERHLRLEEEKSQREQFNVDAQIMSMSLEGLPPDQAKYYSMRKAECMARLSRMGF